jgi:hypothetical protein
MAEKTIVQTIEGFFSTKADERSSASPLTTHRLIAGRGKED